MARPRKTVPSTDPLLDLSKKTEILEREMSAQRAAMDRLRQMSSVRPQPLHVRERAESDPLKRRASR
jgi:hypothetical protein